jgi:hypothetical protein
VFRVSGTVQSANATATNAFQLFRRIRISPTLNDTIYPAQVTFPLDYDRRLGLTGIIFGSLRDNILKVGGADLLGGLQASGIVRLATGLPYTRTDATGDTIIGLPNSDRLPAQAQFDALLRRTIRLGPVRGTMYLDVRNLTNKRNILALRRDTGTPGLGDAGSNAAAQTAYAAHPEPIPYESPRYRPAADLNQDGLIVGAELLTMYQRAAHDYYQPLFAYGPPRLVRLGFEVIF